MQSTNTIWRLYFAFFEMHWILSLIGNSSNASYILIVNSKIVNTVCLLSTTYC